MNPSNARAFAQALSHTNTLGEAARPLLSVLSAVTGLECTFLTHVDPLRRRLRIDVSHPTRADGVVVPEGISCAWDVALCKNALDDGVVYTAEADRLWPHNMAVQDMGVRTYASQPVWSSHGTLLGTLCAADTSRVALSANDLAVLHLFADLLAYQIERQESWDDARHALCETQSAMALERVLGGLTNRSAVENRLRRALGLVVYEESLEELD